MVQVLLWLSMPTVEKGGKIGRTIPLDEFPMRLGIGKIEVAAWHGIDSCILRVVESRARQCSAQALRRFNEREGAVTIEAPALNACQRRPDPTGPRSCVCGLALVPLLCRAKRRVAPGVCGRARASQSRRRGFYRCVQQERGRSGSITRRSHASSDCHTPSDGRSYRARAQSQAASGGRTGPSCSTCHAAAPFAATSGPVRSSRPVGRTVRRGSLNQLALAGAGRRVGPCRGG